MRLLFLLLISVSCFGQNPTLQNFFMINKDQCYTFKNAEGKTIDSVNNVLGQKYLYKEKVAIDSLISMLKTNGTWNKYYAIYTMAGGNWKSCGINYKNASSTFLATPNYTAYTTNQATNYSRKFGIKGDGFDNFINTVVSNSDLTQTNFSFGFYCIKPYKTTGTAIGSFNGSYSNFFEIQTVFGFPNFPNPGDTYNGFNAYSNTNTIQLQENNINISGFNGGGYTVASRSAANSFKLFTNNNTPSASAQSTSNGGGNGGQIYLNYRNGVSGTFNNSCFGSYVICNSALTQSEAATDYASWNIYFNLLGVTRYGYSNYNNTKIVIDGDSQSANNGYPAWWIPNNTSSTGIQASFPPQLNSYNNVAVNGTAIGPASDATSMLGRQATNVLPLYNGSLTHNVVVLWGGTNDICNGRSAVDIFADIVTYVNAAKATGFKVVVATVLPRTQAACGAVISGTYETVRLALNNLIRNNTQTYSYEVADVALDQNMGTSSTASNNTTYYNADKVHLTVTGATTLFKYFHGAIMNLIY